MTENKRFSVTANDENFLIIIDNERALSQLQVCALLNDLNDENNELREYNKEMVKDIKDLEERIDRQAEQLDRLYKLIEAKDWKALSDIIDDFRRGDEQLQIEWGRY